MKGIIVYCITLLLISEFTNSKAVQVRQLSNINETSVGATNVHSMIAQKCTQAYALGCDYAEWKKNYNVSYATSEEDQRRQAIYCTNCLANREASLNSSYTLVEREDAAMTEEERRSKSLTNVERRGVLSNFVLPTTDPATEQRVKAILDTKVGVSLPTSLDYTNYNGQNYLTSVKDQGSCGCCWSFAATAQYESLLKLNGFSYDLSAQAALECTSFYAPNQRVSDCSGGYFSDPMYFLSKVGSVLLSTYPYISGNYGSGSGYPTTNGICTEQNRIFLGSGSVNLYSNLLTSTQVKSLLYTYGPMMVGVYADSGWYSYSSGTYSGCPSNSASLINHAVLLYGWDSSGNWLIRNQWGSSWGQGGNIVISNSNDCGLKNLLGFVTVANKNTNVQVTMDPGYTGSNWEGYFGGIALISFLIACLLY